MNRIAKLMVIFLVLALVTMGCSQSAPKEENKTAFPTKPIEMVVPFAPGGATDVAARIVANAVNKYMPNGQSVVVTNKAGGGGVVATVEAFTTAADGYKLLYISTTPLSISPITTKTPYTHDSFQPIVRVLTYSQVIAVRKDSPWKTFEEWVAYCKANPEKFTYGTQGVGTSAHLAMEELAATLGIKLKHVPFDGASLAQTALLGGHVQGILVASTDLNLDELRILVDFGSHRNPRNKDIPTLTEKEVNIKHDLYSGVAAPKGLPKDVLDILHTAFKKALEDPATQEAINKVSLDPAYLGPEDFQNEISKEFTSYKTIIENIGLKK